MQRAPVPCSTRPQAGMDLARPAPAPAQTGRRPSTAARSSSGAQARRLGSSGADRRPRIQTCTMHASALTGSVCAAGLWAALPGTAGPRPFSTDSARPDPPQALASMQAGMRATAAPAPWRGRRARRRARRGPPARPRPARRPGPPPARAAPRAAHPRTARRASAGRAASGCSLPQRKGERVRGRARASQRRERAGPGGRASERTAASRAWRVRARSSPTWEPPQATRHSP